MSYYYRPLTLTREQMDRAKRNAMPVMELFVLFFIGTAIYHLGNDVANHLTGLTVPIGLTLLSLCARWTYHTVLKVIALAYTVFTIELGLAAAIWIFDGKDATHAIQTTAGLSLYNASLAWVVGCLLAYLITGYVTYRWIFPRRYAY